MGEVTLNIHGREYGIACDDGQEERVAHLGHFIDSRLREIAAAGGAANDAHLLVLTALVIADEVHELREQMRYMTPANGTPQPERVTAEEEHHIVQTIEHLAGRINAVATRLQKVDKAA